MASPNVLSFVSSGNFFHSKLSILVIQEPIPVMRSIRITVLAAVVVATVAWFAAAPYRARMLIAQAKASEAARLNNIGVAYMNQQLFEKALKSFESGQRAGPETGDCAGKSGRGSAQPPARG